MLHIQVAKEMCLEGRQLGTLRSWPGPSHHDNDLHGSGSALMRCQSLSVLLSSSWLKLFVFYLQDDLSGCYQLLSVVCARAHAGHPARSVAVHGKAWFAVAVYRNFACSQAKCC